MTVRVSDYIAQHLNIIGAPPVFMLAGGGMMHLVDAVAVEGLPYICNHHEQACAMGAEGYARQTGDIGVCYATSGPGATNILTGVAGSWLDSAPVLFITGQSKRSQTVRLAEVEGLRQFGTFEVDILPMVQNVTKYAHFLDDPEKVRYELEKAIFIATTGRPGPVLIDIPLDVQGAPIDPAGLIGFEPSADELPKSPTKSDLSKIGSRIEEANRPLFVVGHGVRCAGHTNELRLLAEKLMIPVVTTQLAKDALPYDHSLFVGHSGPKGDRPGNFAVQTADLIISIGSSLQSQTIGYEAELFAPNAFKIQFDSDPAVLGRGDVPVDLQIEADIGLAVSALLGLNIESKINGSWKQKCQSWKTNYAVTKEPHNFATNELNFYEFADALSSTLTGTETIVTDAGSAFYVLGQAFRLKGDQRYLVSGGLGAMGYSLPAAIGAAIGAKGNPVVCVTGDGSLQTNSHELLTLAHNNLNVKLFVIDNGGYASIRNTQEGFFEGRYVGTNEKSGVSMPPLDKLANTYGLQYVDLVDRRLMQETIDQVMKMDGPVFCRVKAQPGQKIFPSVSSRRLADGSLRSNPLHIMSPPLDDDVLAAELGEYLKASNTKNDA